MESMSFAVDSNGVLRNPFQSNHDLKKILTSPENYVSGVLSQPSRLNLSQSYIYLTNFVGRRITPKALLAIDSIFQAHRQRGYKMILRLAYDIGIRTSFARYSDIYRHLDQLAPVIQKNAGVIHTWQAGLLGPWGEWHNTDRYDSTKSPAVKIYDLKDSPDSIRVMIRKMLDILPEGGTIQVRVPTYRTQFGFEDGLMQRIGLHNDAFTAGGHPLAPGNDFVDGPYVYYYTDAKNCSPFVPVGGEMPYNCDNCTDPWMLNTKISVSKSLQTFRDHHYTSLDITQNTKNNILYWTTYQLTADSLNAAGIAFHPEYFKDNGVTVPRTMYQFVRDHFGYNLYFDFDKDVIQSSGGKVSFSLPFRNYGFSRVYNRYKVVAYLLNGSDQVLAEAPVDANPADWHPYRPGDAPSSRMQHYLQGAIPLPAGLAAGSYKIGFGILPLSPDVAADTMFCIRFANRANLRYVVTPDKKVINVSHTFSYNTTARYCVPTSDANGQERYFSRLWTTGATQDIDLAAPLKPTSAYAAADQTIRVKQGSSFNLNAVTTDDSKYSRIRAWVDWNGDGTFTDDPSEVVFAIGNPNTENSALLKNFVQSVGIPANAKVGSTVMRVRFYQAWQTNPGPCGYQIQNTTFDFPVYVDTTVQQSLCTTSSIGGVTDRYITSLSTSGAKHNLSVPAMAIPVDNYQFFRNDVIVTEPGGNFSLTAATTDHTKWDLVKAWIDWNGDGVLANDSTETVFLRGTFNPPTPTDNAGLILNFTEQITIPANAKPGARLFRLRFGDAWRPIPGPCGNDLNSTTYDFLIHIQEPGYCIPTSNGVSEQFYPTSLKTQNAQRNLNMTTPLLPENSYKLYTADYLGVSPGSTFDLIGTSSFYAKWSQVRAWADWNGDGLFADDATEKLFDLGIHNPTVADSIIHNAAIWNFSQSIVVPASVKLGVTRIRIRYYNAWDPYPGPCSVPDKNTTFDFIVKVETPVGDSYCPAGSNGLDQERYLTSLTTTGAIHNVSVPAASLAPVNGYQIYRDDAITTTPGGAFNLAGTSTPTTKWNRISLWVDWNGNGSFDPSENVFSLGNQASDNSATVLSFNQSISVPASAKPGTVRARIRVHNSWYSVPGACGDAPNTTTFDFLVNVQGTTYCKPQTDDTIYAPTISITSLTTSGAVHNLNTTSELKPERGYRYYENDALVVNAGSSFNLHAINSEPTKWAQVRAWIDWNGDGAFTDGGNEELFSLGTFHADGTSMAVRDFLKSINVPATARQGYSRLRLRFWNSWLAYPGPCNYLDQSSTFDFPVLVLGSGVTTYSVASYREAASAEPATRPNAVLYPNPVSKSPVHVKLPESFSGKANVEILDAQGRSVTSFATTLEKGALQEDVHSLHPGLYFLVLKTAGKTWTFRFVKE